ncbi:MAG: phosphotransferase family protein, partial [Actinomycetota bacterium]
MSPEPTGINAANVTAWMADRIPDLAGPLDFELITGGASNLTFRVTDKAGGTWVLRRPPTGHVLASAHDMSREHRIIAALDGTGVPVPPAIGLCQDDDVNGADFYVMGFVDGQIVFNHEDGLAYPEDKRAGLAESLVDTLVDLHALVPADVG